MGKKYIQYDKTTGKIVAVTSGKMKKDADGNRFVEKPDFTKLPEAIGGLEVESDVQTHKKKVNLSTMVIEDVVKTDFELFQEQWSHRKIIECLLDENKRKELVQEAKKHEVILSEVI